MQNTPPKGSDHRGPLLKSAAQTAITQHFLPSAGARRGATHTASIGHQEKTCARKKRLGNGSMFDSYHCCKHLSRNSHSHLRLESGTSVGRGQAVGDAVYLVCKAVRSSNTPMVHSFEVLAASGELARAVDSARQTFCEASKLQVQFTHYFCAQYHGNSVRPAWKASNVFASPEPRGVAQACCGFCGRVFAEGPDISPALLPEIWAPPVAAGPPYQSELVRSLLSMCSHPYTRHKPSHLLIYACTLARMQVVSLEASCRRCHVCGAGEACSSGQDGVRCSRTALRVWVQRALLPASSRLPEKVKSVARGHCAQNLHTCSENEAAASKDVNQPFLYAVVSGARESRMHEVWNQRSAKCSRGRDGLFGFSTAPSIVLAWGRSLSLSLPHSFSPSLGTPPSLSFPTPLSLFLSLSSSLSSSLSLSFSLSFSLSLSLSR